MSSQTQMAPILSNMDHYYKAYKCFSATGISNQKKVLDEWMEKEFELKVANKLWGNLSGTSVGSDQPLRVLGVGSAQGKYMNAIRIQIFLNLFKKKNYVPRYML